MKMSNSSLISYTKLSPHNSGKRTEKISKITIHHMSGNMSAKSCCDYFATTSREVSANYCIGSDGAIGMSVEEGNRAWTSCSRWNDQRAVTIEVANCTGAPTWKISDKAMASLIKLCIDICKRNGIKELKFTGDQNGTLTYHYMFSSTDCPGPYIKSKTDYICKQVNAGLKTATAKPASKPATKAASAPAKVIGPVYTIKPGDMLSKVASRYGCTLGDILKVNSVKNPDKIYAGQTIYLPGDKITIKVGYTVRINQGAKTCQGSNLPAKSYSTSYKVKIAAKNGSTLISLPAWMWRKDLTVIAL